MTITGRVPLLLAVGVVAAIAWPVPLTVVVWVGLVAIAVLVDLAAATRPDQLQIERSLAASVRLTEPSGSRLTITNTGRHTARLRVRDAWPPSAGAAKERPLIRLAGGESRRQSTGLYPTRRGDLVAGPVTVRSFGPLGLAARQRSMDVPGTLRVLPEFRSRSHLPSRLARLRELDGQSSVQVRGQGTEFDSLREYALGDDVRSIDWRASARAVRTMVRTWRPERDRHILLVLDTSRWAAGRISGDADGSDQTRLDAGIETCLLTTALGAASGDRLSLLAADRQVHIRLAGVSRGAEVIARFAEGLSRVEPVLLEADWRLVATQINQLCRQRSLVILITGLDPATHADGLGPVLPALAHDHQVIIAQVEDPASLTGRADDAPISRAYDAAASARLGLAAQALAARVSRMGVEVVTAGPDQLAPAVCDRYLALKAAGRL